MLLFLFIIFFDHNVVTDEFPTPSSFRHALTPNSEFVFWTTKRFDNDFGRTIAWDHHGNQIINARFPGNGTFTIHVKDKQYSNLLLADIAGAKNEGSNLLGFNRLTLCNVLAQWMPLEINLEKTLKFTYDECYSQSEVHELFPIRHLGRKFEEIMEHMNTCYKEKIYKVYDSCIRIHLSTYFYQGEEDPCEFYKMELQKDSPADWAVDDNLRLGSHLRQICFFSGQEIFHTFQEAIDVRAQKHNVVPFEMEFWYLHTAQQNGSMTLCFPVASQQNETENREDGVCGQGFAPIIFSATENSLVLNMTIGNENTNETDPTTAFFANQHIPIHPSLDPNELHWVRLSFNRYTAIYGINYVLDKITGKIVPMEKIAEHNILVIPTNLINVQGNFNTFADEVPVRVENTFHDEFFFLRIGRHPSTIKCWHGYLPSRFGCYNLGSSALMDCEFNFENETTMLETIGEEKEEFGSGENILDLMKRKKISDNLEWGWHIPHMRKMLPKFLYGSTRLSSIKVRAPPHKRDQIWQKTYSCFTYRIWLPNFA